MGFLLAGTHASIRHITGACIKPAKHGESQYGKKKGEGNKKNGNKYLAWAYVEAANFMRRYSEPARSWHQRKASKTNKIVAIKALSNKIARACYFIIKDQKPFDPKKLFQ